MYPMKINPGRINLQGNQLRNSNVPNASNTNFESILKSELNKDTEVKFSKHAMDRLEERNIQLSNNEMNRLNTAMNKAESKGINETLIIMDNKAFIASVPNRTVITATTGNQLKDNIFTNIDGAIFI